MSTLAQHSQDLPTRVDHTYHVNVLVPPRLPPFLATLFDLKPISGSPSTEEVKLVHAAIRTLSTLLQTPEPHDSTLPVELSQHLFDIQMVRYLESHTVGTFPNDIVYMPPSLPSHIPIALEPVVGPPSDDQLRSAHAAFRALGSFVNVASVFDADLGMELSQHLFDLQLARHIQRSTRVQPSATRPVLPNDSSMRVDAPDLNPTRGRNERRDVDTNSDTRLAETSRDIHMNRNELNDIQRPGVHQSGERPVTQGHEVQDGLQETNTLLVEIRETLKNVNKVLVGTQNCMARGFNSSYWGGDGRTGFGAHSLINDKGETPKMHGLPTLHDRNWGSGSIHPDKLSMNLLARYLQFYGIGNEVINHGEEWTIMSGMENEAKAILRRHVYAHEG